MYDYTLNLKLHPTYKILIYIIFSMFFFIDFPVANEKHNNFEFQSLRFNKSFMRIGPAKKFPIKWVFIRKGLPVKILEKFENWKKIEAPDGTTGWMRKDQLKNKKTVIFISNGKIYSYPRLNSNILANVEISSILKLENCKKIWCKVHSHKHNLTGYTLKKKIWGATIN